MCGLKDLHCLNGLDAPTLRSLLSPLHGAPRQKVSQPGPPLKIKDGSSQSALRGAPVGVLLRWSLLCHS